MYGYLIFKTQSHFLDSLHKKTVTKLFGHLSNSLTTKIRGQSEITGVYGIFFFMFTNTGLYVMSQHHNVMTSCLHSLQLFAIHCAQIVGRPAGLVHHHIGVLQTPTRKIPNVFTCSVTWYLGLAKEVCE